MRKDSLENKLYTAADWGIAAGIVAGVGRFVIDLFRGRNFDQAAAGAVETGATVGVSAAAANLAKNTVAQGLPAGQAEILAAGAAVMGREAMRTVFEKAPQEVDIEYLTNHVR